MVKHRASYMKFSSPASCLCVIFSLGAERVESVHTFSQSLSVIKDSIRCEKLHSYWMICWKSVQLIFHNKGKIDIISRSPDASLSIYKTLYAINIALSRDLKEACGLFLAIGNLQIAGGNTVCCSHDKWFSTEFEVCKASRICPSGADLLKLIIICCHPDPR